MRIINIDVNTTDVINIGHQYDHYATRVVFAGYEMEDPTNELYLKVVGRVPSDNLLVPIVDMAWDVTQPFSKRSGKSTFQLEERKADGTFVGESALFEVELSRSIKAESDYEVVDDRLELVYTKYNDMYNVIHNTNETAAQNESERQAQWQTLKSQVMTYVPVEVAAYFDAHKDEFKGDPGYTPVKGVDYFTDAEIAAITQPIEEELTSQKESLNQKVGFTDYATDSKAGIVRARSDYGLKTTNNGAIFPNVDTAEQYKNRLEYYFVGKGTLENVLAERLKEPKFELIEEFTLTRDEPIERSTEPNGTPYKFKKVIVEIITPPWSFSTTWFPLFANTNEFSGILLGALSVVTTATRYYSAYTEIVGGRLIGYCVNGSGYTNGQKVDSSTGAFGHYSGDYINKISTGASSGTMPSGTQVKIYGMRA